MINKTTAKRIPKFMPFQESVTYSKRTGNDTFTTSTVRARRKKINKEAKSVPQEILLLAELTWQITLDSLTFEPKVNDYLTDSGSVSWQIVHVIEQFNGQIFNLLARKRV